MNKTIKIIDLLNKISNKETLPNEIEYRNVKYSKKKNLLTGCEYYAASNQQLLLEKLNNTNDLIAEIEIIEDEIDIQEIEKLSTGYSESGADTDIINFINNVIVQAMKQMDKKIKE